jgi:hypothetical protein
MWDITGAFVSALKKSFFFFFVFFKVDFVKTFFKILQVFLYLFFIN